MLQMKPETGLAAILEWKCAK